MWTSLTLFFPFDPPENRKSKGSLIFSGGSKGNIGKKTVNCLSENLIVDINSS